MNDIGHMNSRKTFNLICRLIPVVSAIYVIVRAFTLSFTHDEAVSFTIINGENTYALTANNHLLNTICMKFFHLLGNREWLLRLPNVIAGMIYLFLVYRFTSKLKTKATGYLTLALLCLNPWILEYFSLARGYGLSLSMAFVAFMLIGQLSSARKDQTALWINLFISITLSLSLLASFSSLNILLGLAVWAGYAFWKNNFKNYRKVSPLWVITWIPFVFILVYSLNRLLKLSALDQLYFGANRLPDMFTGWISHTMLEDVLPPWFYYVSVALMLLALVIYLFVVVRFGIGDHVSMVGSVFILSMLFVIIQHSKYFGALFPIERTSLTYFLIFLLFLVLSLDKLLSHGAFKQGFLFKWLCLAMTGMMFINFLFKANLSYAHTWKYDCNTKEVCLDALHATTKDSIFLSGSWLFEPTVNYYIETRNLVITKMQRNGPDPKADYLYIHESDLDKLEKMTLKKTRSFPCSEAVLYQNEQKD